MAEAIEAKIARALPKDIAVVVTDRLFRGNSEDYGRHMPDIKTRR
jgi:hypothetical protein